MTAIRKMRRDLKNYTNFSETLLAYRSDAIAKVGYTVIIDSFDC